GGVTEKKIALGGHFRLTLAGMEGAPSHGFALVGDRDDQATFSWDWFNIDDPSHPTSATKLQELGKLSIKARPEIKATEIKFLTDVSVRVARENDADPRDPTWRIKILKGSVVDFPK
ncbi:MAG TPA: hypothetical protein VMI31_12315, partial [Fimbriimonadaceae bacterium]|nr:hypothetical protein [Fimbriimonadaceae bacterium]